MLFYIIVYYIILNYIILYYIIITIIWYVPRHFFGLQYISSGRGTPAHPMREQAAINPTNHAKRAGPWSPPHVWRFFIGKCMVNPSYFGGYSSFSKKLYIILYIYTYIWYIYKIYIYGHYMIIYGHLHWKNYINILINPGWLIGLVIVIIRINFGVANAAPKYEGLHGLNPHVHTFFHWNLPQNYIVSVQKKDTPTQYHTIPISLPKLTGSNMI